MDKHFETSIRKLAMPIILMGLVNILMTMIDQFMVGFYDPTAVASIYMGGQYRSFIFLILPIISTGAGVLMNQNFGASKFKEASDYSGINFMLSSVVSALLFAAIFFNIDTILRLLNTPENLYTNAKIYMTITSFYLLVQGITFGVSTHLQMLGKTKPMLYAVIGMQIVNISLNYLLIFGNFGFPEMGVEGSAYATLISTLFGTLIFLYFGFIKIRIKVTFRKFNGFWIKSKKIIKIGSAKSIEPSIWMACTLISVSAIGHLGETAFTAFSYSRMLSPLSTSVSGGIGRASAIITGYYYGVGEYKNMKHTIAKSMKTGMIIAAISSTLLIFISPIFTALFTNDSVIINMVVIFSIIGVVTETFRVLNIVGVHSLAAGHDIKWVAKRAPIIMIIFIASIPLLVSYTLPWGIYLIMGSFAVDEIIRGSLVYYRFKRVKFNNPEINKDTKISLISESGIVFAE